MKKRKSLWYYGRRPRLIDIHYAIVTLGYPRRVPNDSMPFCPKFELECPYWKNFGDGAQDDVKLLCVGNSDQCWTWRHPRGKPARGRFPDTEKTKLPEKAKLTKSEKMIRQIEVGDDL